MFGFQGVQFSEGALVVVSVVLNAYFESSPCNYSCLKEPSITVREMITYKTNLSVTIAPKVIG